MRKIGELKTKNQVGKNAKGDRNQPDGGGKRTSRREGQKRGGGSLR